MKHGYLFDKFVNYRLNQEKARAIFDKTNKVCLNIIKINFKYFYNVIFFILDAANTHSCYNGPVININ